jgi:hypothetical protein
MLSLLFCVCSTTNTKKEPFTVRLESPKISLGKIEAQFDGLLGFGKIRNVDVTVDYYPGEDAVCLQYRLDFMTYYQFWDREGRDAYPGALAQYKEDFEQRNLAAKGSRKTRRKYGRVDCYLIWQASAFLVRAKANTFLDLGYDIKMISDNRAAFFTLYQREAEFLDEVSKRERRRSQDMPMYLTRTQADDLAELFNQQFINSLVPGSMERRIGNTNIDAY